jgi:hypothetical protein
MRKDELSNTQVIQNTGLGKTQRARRPAPRLRSMGITKTQKRRLQKMHQRELAEKKEEEERVYWFNRLRPMTRPKQTWWEKWFAKEEDDSSGEEVSMVTPVRWEDNPRLGDGNPEFGNCNPKLGICHLESGNHYSDLGNNNLGKVNDQQGEESVPMDINMVFTIPAEFCAPMEDIAELALGAECAMFEKPENPDMHMKPLFIREHLDGTSIGHMLIDGCASFNILPLSLFKKLGHIEGDLKRTNLRLSGFAGDPTEAKGLICMELTAGSKTVPMTFFVEDVKGCYNMLLRRDWIHANECVPSTLHQCVINGSVMRWRWFKPMRRCALSWSNLKSTS